MPLDAVCLQAVVQELSPMVTGCHIEKIQQPARDQVVLLRGGKRLLLYAGGSQPRLQLTETLRDNPAQPPMFCMLLRKHLGGGIIREVVQELLERVVTLHILAADELGQRSEFRLVLEAVNRRANLILVDREGRVVDCMRRVDFEMNPERQVLSGLFYRLPAAPEKRSPLTVTEGELEALLASAGEDRPLDKWLTETFTALSPLAARELSFRACGDAAPPVSAAAGRLWPVLRQWQKAVEGEIYDSCWMISSVGGNRRSGRSSGDRSC